MAADTGRVLLNLRASHKTHSHHWSLWGGMSEPGESPAETLRREISEEMGTVETTRIYPFDVYESRAKDFRYYTFVWVVPREFSPTINPESAGYAWCDPHVWPRPLHQGVRSTFATRRGESLLEIIRAQYQGATNRNG